MLTEKSFFHTAQKPWQYVDKTGEAHLTLRVDKGLRVRIECHYGDPCDTVEFPPGVKTPKLKTAPLTLTLSDSEFDYYRVTVPMDTHKLRYHFTVSGDNGERVYDETGLSGGKDERFIRPFFVSYTFGTELYGAPLWARGTVWYQIFPDRFCQLDSSTGSIAPWVSEEITDKDKVYGGNLAGITSRIPYLKELGVTGIYLNPIFQAKSVHKYDTLDYGRIDAGFGTEDDFRSLCDTCHQNGIRVMLDGVFNHGSHESEPFQSVLRDGKDSPYYDWFIINDAGRIAELAAMDSSDGRNKLINAYEMFSFVPSMPKWNTENEAVIEYLVGLAEEWTTRYHIDAWRLDVPDEVTDEFLRRFRRRMKTVSSDTYIIGEIWSDATHWLSGDMFDGVMNYTLYFAVRDFIALESIDAQGFTDRLVRCLVKYSESGDGMFNFCGNHDLPRIFTLCGENERKVLLCQLLCTVMSGGVSIYYGDEIPLAGGADPDNRRVMPWGDSRMDSAFRREMASIASLKAQLAGSPCKGVRAMDADTVELLFGSGKRVLINRSESRKTVCLDEAGEKIEIPAFGYVIIENKA